MRFTSCISAVCPAEAVLFASVSPVSRENLTRVVGQEASIDLLIDDLDADLEGRTFEVFKAAGGWMLHTRSAYAPAISMAKDIGDQQLYLNEFGIAVLAAIAYPQPVIGAGFKDIYGREIIDG